VNFEISSFRNFRPI